MQSDPTLKKWYRFLNKKFFSNQLTNNVCVRWSNEDDEESFEEKYFGVADKGIDGHEYEIVMSRELNHSASVRMATLAHEMIHIATELKDNHGPAFELWRQTLSDRGLFKKGAVRKGLTLF
jgi:SprT-like family